MSYNIGEKTLYYFNYKNLDVPLFLYSIENYSSNKLMFSSNSLFWEKGAKIDSNMSNLTIKRFFSYLMNIKTLY